MSLADSISDDIRDLERRLANMESDAFKEFRETLTRAIADGFMISHKSTPTLAKDFQKIGRGKRTINQFFPVLDYTKLDPWHGSTGYKPDMIGYDKNGNMIGMDFKLSGRAADVYVIDEVKK